MRLREGEDRHRLEIRSGRWTVLAMGLPFVLIPLLFIIGSVGMLRAGPGASAPVQGMMWIFQSPVILFVLVILGVVAFLYTRRYAALRRTGQSTARFSRPALFWSQEESFDLGQIHHLVLHTDRSTQRSRNGASTTTLLSTLYTVLHDGHEVVLGESRRIGTFGDQPGLNQARQVEIFTDKPLERTGFGAPPSDPPSGIAGRPRM